MGGDPAAGLERALEYRADLQGAQFARNTVRPALRSERPSGNARSPSGSKLDAFRWRIEELLAEDGRVPGEIILERLREAGYEGSRTILNDLLRELRPRFVPARTYQRTRYEPGGVCQFDLWHVTRPVPVGSGQERQGYVAIATLGYSRASAAALVFSHAAPDVLWGITRCLGWLGGLPRRLARVAYTPAWELDPRRGVRTSFENARRRQRHWLEVMN